MADERDLKQLYSDIETDEVEMARYRARLATTLKAAPAPQVSVRTNQRWLLPLLAVAAATLLGWWMQSPAKQTVLPDLEPEALAQYLHEESIDRVALLAQAEQLKVAEDPRRRGQAMIVLCLLQPGHSGVEVALAGLGEPLPEFRAFFLEHVMDQVDPHSLDMALIERLMDREEDSQCRRLFQSLINWV